MPRGALHKNKKRRKKLLHGDSVPPTSPDWHWPGARVATVSHATTHSNRSTPRRSWRWWDR